MKMTVGDIFDKWSILRMKFKLSDDVSVEYDDIRREVAVKEKDFYKIQEYVFDLIEANSKIWILESDIRNGKDMPLEEVGRRALQIRDINKMRIEAKNKINEIFGDYQEIKVNHASERTT
jgi:hypothetical protein